MNLSILNIYPFPTYYLSYRDDFFNIPLYYDEPISWILSSIYLWLFMKKLFVWNFLIKIANKRFKLWSSDKNTILIRKTIMCWELSVHNSKAFYMCSCACEIDNEIWLLVIITWCKDWCERHLYPSNLSDYDNEILL